MNLKLGNVLGGVLLIVLAAGTWYLSRPPAPAAVRPAVSPPRPAGYYMLGARVLGTDDSGRILYRISAAAAEEVPEREGLRLRQVRFAYQPDQAVPWLLTAAEATYVRDSYIDLEGGVRLESEPTDAGRRVVVEAEQMRLDPDRLIARSDAPVRIEIDGAFVSGIGMVANLKEDRLQLESSVHGQILP